MPVVAAKVYKNEIVMSCDSQLTSGEHQKSTGYQSNIIYGDNMIVAVVHNAVFGTLLRIVAETHTIETGSLVGVLEWCDHYRKFLDIRYQEYTKPDILIGHSSGLYYAENFVPVLVSDYAAIGSGHIYAEVAMELDHNTQDAVLVATRMCDDCSGDVNTARIRHTLHGDWF